MHSCYHFLNHRKPHCTNHLHSQDCLHYSKTHHILHGHIVSPRSTLHLDIDHHKCHINQSNIPVDSVTDVAYGYGSDQQREIDHAKDEVRDRVNVDSLIHIHGVVTNAHIHSVVINVHEFNGMPNDRNDVVRYVIREPYGHEVHGDFDDLDGLNECAAGDVFQYDHTCLLYSHLITIAGE